MSTKPRPAPRPRRRWIQFSRRHTVRGDLPRPVTDGGIAVNRCVSTLAVALLLPATAAGKHYFPPVNVRDPSQQAKAQACDRSLPLIYLEPHDFCYDIARPVAVTLSAVNRSKKPQSIDWRAICGSLVLEPVGSGRVTPVRNRPTPKSVPLASMDLAQVTIDLWEWFQMEGAGAYRLSYARPLEDGRIHIAAPAQFVIEDDAAVEKLAAELDAGPVRETFAVLLKDNPVFAAGGLPKTYGWDVVRWGGRPQMLHSPWDEALQAARQKWREGIERLTEKTLPADGNRALETLIERLLQLSDGFRADPGSDFVNHLDARVADCLPAMDRERLYLKLVRSHSQYFVSRSVIRLMSLRSKAALDDLFRIGDGPNRALAEEAIGSLSSYAPDPRIAQYLRRKMTDDDRGLALRAAIVSCYSGDASGGALVVRCMKSDDPALRLKAIAKVVDNDHFRPHRATIVRALLEELNDPTSDAHLERAIHSLEAYPSGEVLLAVKPFLRHQNPHVAQRARMTVSEIQRAKRR